MIEKNRAPHGYQKNLLPLSTRPKNRTSVEPGLDLQGKLVTGEALGDLGGVNLAYRAYKRSREGKGPEPTVDGYTPDQHSFSPKDSGGEPSCALRRHGSASRPILIRRENTGCWGH